MFVLRIQFIGEKAREIMQDEHAPDPKHIETLRRALNELSIPYPDRVRPVWKSGVILCHYTADMDSGLYGRISDTLKTAMRDTDCLNRLFIRYLQLTQNGNPIPASQRTNTKVKREPYNVSVRFKDRSASPPRPSSSSSNRTLVQSALPPRPPSVSTPQIHSVSVAQDIPAQFQQAQWQYPKQVQTQTLLPAGQSTLIRPDTPANVTRQNSFDSNAVPTAEQISLAQQTLRKLSESTNIQALFRDVSIPPKEESIPIPVNFDVPPLPSARERVPEAHIPQTSMTPTRAVPFPFRRRPATPTGPAALGVSHSLPILSSSQRPETPTVRPHPSSNSQHPASSSTHPNGQASNLTRELWDVRRQVVALKARENSLVTQIKEVGGGDQSIEEPVQVQNGKDNSDGQTRQLEGEIKDLRYKLKRTASQLEDAEGAYESERKRRVQAERLWEDARREYRTPFVVPAMVDAFERLAQLAGDALTDIDDDIVYTGSHGWEQSRRGGG